MTRFKVKVMTPKMVSMFSSYKLLGFLKKGYQDTFVDNLDLT